MSILNIFLNDLGRKITPDMIFNLILGFTTFSFIWKFYLAYRQFQVYTKTEKVPKQLKGVMDQEKFSKARLYSIDKSLYNFVYMFYSQILNYVILIFGGYHYAWVSTRHLLEHFGYYKNDELTLALVMLNLSSILLFIIDLPWSIYYSFVIEERHGFNKYTLSFYLKDKIKKLVVMQAISLPITALAFYIIKNGGDYFFLYLWVFCSIVMLILTYIYPDYISPLFDKYIPLPESELKNKINELALSLKYPLKRIFVVEGSKRSSHSNAYLYGMFNNKTIVLFDTLIDKSVLDLTGLFGEKKEEDNKENEEKNDDDKEKLIEKEQENCNEKEILAVLGHELGHWSLSHLVKMMILSQINLLMTLSVFGLLYKNQKIYSAFGFTNEQPILIGLTIIFEFIFDPYNEIVGFLMTCLTRKFEFQADNFANKLGKGEELKNALIKLNHTNLGFPINDWLYSAWNHSHPPLLERMAAIDKMK